LEYLVSDGERGATITALYLSDCLSDLVEACTRLVKGSAAESCEFLEEPGLFRWKFLASDGNLRVEVYWFEEEVEGSAAELRFVGDLELEVFGRLLLHEMDRLREEFRGGAYQARWGHPYPELQVRLLRDSLGV
jgi:hypothetical protein